MTGAKAKGKGKGKGKSKPSAGKSRRARLVKELEMALHSSASASDCSEAVFSFIVARGTEGRLTNRKGFPFKGTKQLNALRGQAYERTFRCLRAASQVWHREQPAQQPVEIVHFAKKT